MRIWKYALSLGPTRLSIPDGAKILRVGAQGDEVVFWALVEPDAPKRSRKFQVVGTGHEVPTGEYIGGASMGPFEWHVFEVRP